MFRSLSPGVSIIIPVRANRVQLRDCLRSAIAACTSIAEPFEIIVVASDYDASRYSDLIREHASIRWLFSPRPIKFRKAVQKGLKTARYEWVYLLSDDMILDPLALCALLPWRGWNIFAISSQICFKDPQKHREETGWTRFTPSTVPTDSWDALPDDGFTVRGNFYARGGASLFQRKLLTELIRHSAPYDPFYWEDVEWGTRAWRKGWQVLFCPASKVWHEHRATNQKLFDESQIPRIQKRNRIVYYLRNHLGEESYSEFDKIISLFDRKTLLEILRPDRAIRIISGRIGTSFLPFRDMPLQYAWRNYYLKPPDLSHRPLMLVVTPYAVFPPAHGGAQRIYNLLEALSERFDIVFLSDEVDGYTAVSTNCFSALASFHLVGGRPEMNSDNRVERMSNHSHVTLREQLRFLLAAHRPSLVQIEYAELSPLAALREGSVPWFLTLHDVQLSGDGSRTAEDEYETGWIKQYDAVIACSGEDALLVPHEHVFVVPNGATIHGRKCSPSPDRPAILFMGPFRYQRNLEGIQEFLQMAYGSLRKLVSGLELWILGGQGASEIAAGLKCFDQPGVCVTGYVEHPLEWLQRCALTINPLQGVRGSCVKVIESVAAGRVCVSTREGARGFAQAGFSSLVVTETVEDFIEPLAHLLLNPGYRRTLESVPEEDLMPFSWKHAADLQADIYGQWMMKERIASPPGF